MPPETHYFSQFAAGMLERHGFPLEEAELRAELDLFTELETSRGLEVDCEAVVADLDARCESPFALFEALVRDIAGPGEIWGEKTPDHLLWWRPIARAAPWMRFVVVVRDPRAVVASNLGMPWLDDPRVPAWGEQVHLAFAERWNCLERQAKKLCDELGPARSIVVRYEDVAADPDSERSRIAEFLGRPHPAQLQPVPQGIVLPWEPWKKEALGPVTSARLGAWHLDLGEQRATEVSALTRAGLRHLGYDEDVPSAVGALFTKIGLGPHALARLVRYRRSYERFMEDIDRRRL